MPLPTFTVAAKNESSRQTRPSILCIYFAAKLNEPLALLYTHKNSCYTLTQVVITSNNLSLRAAPRIKFCWEKRCLVVYWAVTILSKLETDQEQWLDHWAERIHCSSFAVIIIPLLEIGRGLGFLASQALLLAQPVLKGLSEETDVTRWVALLEDPVALEKLIERIERKAECDG